METIAPHEIERELTDPPPRPARLPWRTQALLLLAGLLSALLLLGGARALVEAGRLAWVSFAGRPVVAHLTAIDNAPARSDNAPARSDSAPAGPGNNAPAGPGNAGAPTGVHFRYVDPFTGRPVVRFAPLDATPPPDASPLGAPPAPAKSSAAPSLRVGDTLPLRIVGSAGHEQVYIWTTSPWGQITFLILCGAAVMAVGVRLMMILHHWRLLRTRLLHRGQAVVGTVIHKRSDVGDTPRYYLRYGYATVPARVSQEHEEQVALDQWKRFDVGQPVTVLYDPDEPAVAGLYALMR